MAGAVDQLQSAGFSDDEIGTWSKTQRTTLTAAGFGDDEIDTYLGGPKKPVPRAFLDRLSVGTAILDGRVPVDKGAYPEATMHGGTGSFLAGLWRGLTAPGDELREALKDKSGAEVAGAVVGRVPIGQIIDQIRQGGESLGAAFGGQPVSGEEMVGNALLGMTGPVTRLPGGGVTRIARGPVGDLHEQVIGNLPENPDFANAARDVAGLPVPVAEIRAKIEALWQDHGIHPAEVAHDAARDPTIAQDLASSGKELPRAYVEPGAQPHEGAPGEPPAGIAPTAEPPPQIAEAGGQPQIRGFSPSELRLDPDRFQFKAGADSAGVSERLRGVEQWDPIKAGLGIVYEDEAGAPWIVDGHQRLGLARRIGEADPAQQPRLNAWVLRAADGVSDADVRAVAAAKNIAEGTGSPVDAAKVLRDRPDLLPSLPPRSELVRQAQGLMNLDQEAFGKVVNGVVPANHAAIVGRLAPDDPAMQNALIDLLAKTAPDNAVQAESIVRQGLDAGLHRETQATLFGDEDVVSSLYGERARILDRALRQLRRDRSVFRSIVDNSAIIEELGNRLAQDENARQAATDGYAVQILQTLANRKGGIGDSLTGAARAVADGSANRDAATRDFVAEIRRQAASGDLARLADGGGGSALASGGAGATATRPATAGATQAEHGVRDVGPAEEARAEIRVAQAITPTVEPTPQGEQLIIPGAERSAVQAAASREAEGRGRATTDVPQEEPGGLFAEPAPAPEEPGLLRRLAEEESGALRFKPAGPPLTAAEESIRGTIDFDAKRERQWSWSRLYTQVMDKLNPIPSRGPLGEELPTSQNPYQLMRLLAGSPGRAEGWLKYGQRDFATGDQIGPSMRDILAPVQGDLERFDIFATSVRALELDKRGIKTGKSVSAAAQVAADGLDRYGPVLARLIQYQDNLARYLRDAGVLSPEGYAAMREANQLYVPFYRVFADEEIGQIGGGGSLQPQNPINRIKGSERQTVPALESIMRNTYVYITQAERNVAGTALVDLLRLESDAHGAIRDLSATHLRDAAAAPPKFPTTPPSPIAAAEPAAARPDFFPERGPVPADISAAARPVADVTEAGVADVIRGLLADHGISDDLFDFVASSVPPAEGEIRIFRNGKPETWQVGTDIARAVKALDQDSVNLLTRLLAPGARLLRAGATLSPDFLLRNPIRDFFSAVVNTTTGVFTPIRTMRGLTSAIIKDENFQRWLDGGGGNATLVSMDRRYLQESLRDLNEATGLMNRAWNVVRHPLDALRMLSELSEHATRVGEFRVARERELAAGASEKEAAQTAAFASREVTVDFARIGASMRSMNMATAFFNASLQGSDRLARAFRDDPLGTGVKVAAGITAPSVLLWLINHDDPDYQELPAWQRDLFWIVPVGSAAPSPLRVAQAEARGEAPTPSAKFYFRVPKPFELGVLFGSGVERLLDAYVAERPDATRDFAKSVTGALLPSIVPTELLPIAEQWANRSFFTDRNLIPKSLEHQLPEYQYQPYTTETAKKLGQIIAAFPGVRSTSLGAGPMGEMAGGVGRALTTPILMENYLRGWTGGLGGYALQIVDAGLRKSGVIPDPPKPADTLADIPVVKAFVARHPSGGAESIQRFYDDYERNKRFFDSWMGKAQEGDQAAMTRIEEAGGARLFVQLDGIKEALGEHSKLVRDIWKDPDIRPEEKRQLIDQLYYSEIQIAAAGRAQMTTIDKALAATTAK